MPDLVDGCLQCLMTLYMQTSQRPAQWRTITFFQQDDIPDTISNSRFWPGCCNLALIQAVEALQDLVSYAYTQLQSSLQPWWS